MLRVLKHHTDMAAQRLPVISFGGDIHPANQHAAFVGFSSPAISPISVVLLILCAR